MDIKDIVNIADKLEYKINYIESYKPYKRDTHRGIEITYMSGSKQMLLAPSNNPNYNEVYADFKNDHEMQEFINFLDMEAIPRSTKLIRKLSKKK